MAGRTSKFTQENIDDILKSLRDGNFRKVAANSVGVAADTLNTWMHEGEDDLKNDLDTPKSQFYQAVLKAEAEYVKDFVRDINTGNKIEDRKWLITRRFRDDFGDTSNINVKGDMKVEHTITWQDLIKNVQESDKLD